MKSIISLIRRFSAGLIVAIVLLPTLVMAKDQQAQLNVKIVGLPNNQGVVRIALFNSPQAFADKEHVAQVAYRTATAKIQNNQASYAFADLPYGVYAIKLFQDQDLSGKLKKNFLGIPKEPIGFSNNPTLKSGAPSYAQTKFMVNRPAVSMTINMINP